MIFAAVKSLLAPSVSLEAKLKGVSLFFGKTLDKVEDRIVDLEARQLVHGKDGVDGKNGQNGKDGRDGKDGKAGPKGDKGDTGPVGKSGKAGVSVVDAEVAADDHLVLKLSDGKLIDAGELPGSDKRVQHIINTQLANPQIIVSATAPQSPQLNDLWYDIS